MFGYLKDYPDRLPWISGEGAQLGDAWWICVPQSEYQRLQRFEDVINKGIVFNEFHSDSNCLPTINSVDTLYSKILIFWII